MKSAINKLKTILIPAVLLLCCACKFPDPLPDLSSLKTYKLLNLKFGQTTVEEFERLSAGKPNQKIGQDILVFNASAEVPDTYKKVRVGFKKDRLDWIEFNLNEPYPVSSFVANYGKPSNVNTAYSGVLDYFDYGVFNVSMPKDHSIIKHITFFQEPSVSLERPAYKPVNLFGAVPAWKELTGTSILGLKPGSSLEKDLLSDYPALEAKKKNYGETNEYVLDVENGIQQAGYKSVSLVYRNGLLGWINYTPVRLSVDELTATYGKNLTKEPDLGRYDFYRYKELTIAADKKTKKVLSIGKI